MNPQDFERLASRTKLTDRSKALAHAVLVAGMSQSLAARQFNVSRQRASDAVSRIIREHRHEQSAPAGWITVTVTVPPAIAREIEAIAQQARS